MENNAFHKSVSIVKRVIVLVLIVLMVGIMLTLLLAMYFRMKDVFTIS